MRDHSAIINGKMKFSIIDLETTGANREGQKITEIAIINYDGDTRESSYSTLVNPERCIFFSIQKLTGISNDNVFFDYRFLQREFRDLGYLFKREVYCTCKSSRIKFPDLISYSLKNLIKHFNFK